MKLRQLTQSDNLDEASQLFDAYRQFYEQRSDLPAARSFLAARLAAGESSVWLAEQDGRAVGFMQLYPAFCSIALAPIWILNDIYVLPDVRGHGIATKLLDAARELGRSSDCAYLMLATAHTNRKAQRVYEAHGWVLDETYRYYTLGL